MSILFLFQVPIDSCVIGAQHSAFLQQVAHVYCVLIFVSWVILSIFNKVFFVGLLTVKDACLATGLLYYWRGISETAATGWTVSVSSGRDFCIQIWTKLANTKLESNISLVPKIWICGGKHLLPLFCALSSVCIYARNKYEFFRVHVFTVW